MAARRDVTDGTNDLVLGNDGQEAQTDQGRPQQSAFLKIIIILRNDLVKALYFVPQLTAYAADQDVVERGQFPQEYDRAILDGAVRLRHRDDNDITFLHRRGSLFL